MAEHGFDVFATAPKLAAKLFFCAPVFVWVTEQEKRKFCVNDKVQETTTAKDLHHEVLEEERLSHATVDAYFSTKRFCGIQDFAQLIQRFEDEVGCFVILSKQMEAKQGERECD